MSKCAVIVVAVACGLTVGAFGQETGTAAASTQQQVKEEHRPASWESSWQAFVKYCEPFLAVKEKREELRIAMEDKAVEWEGKVQKIDMTMGGPSYEIAMPPVSVTMPEGDATFDAMTVYPKKPNVPSWEKVKVGDHVRFRTTLKSDFPGMLLNVMTSDSIVEPAVKRGVSKGKVLVWISSEDATLIAHQATQSAMP